MQNSGKKMNYVELMYGHTFDLYSLVTKLFASWLGFWHSLHGRLKNTSCSPLALKSHSSC